LNRYTMHLCVKRGFDVHVFLRLVFDSELIKKDELILEAKKECSKLYDEFVDVHGLIQSLTDERGEGTNQPKKRKKKTKKKKKSEEYEEDSIEANNQDLVLYEHDNEAEENEEEGEENGLDISQMLFEEQEEGGGRGWNEEDDFEKQISILQAENSLLRGRVDFLEKGHDHSFQQAMSEVRSEYAESIEQYQVLIS